MARIEPADLDRLPEPALSAYREAMAGRDGPRLHIHGTVGHSPSVLGAFVALANQLRNGTELDPRLRELVIVATSHAHGAGYELGKHWNLALSVGVTRDQLEAIEAGADLVDHPAFEPAEAAAVELARTAASQVRVPDDVWERAAAHFDERALIEIVLHVGMYSFTAHLTEAVDVDIEEWFERK